MRYTPRMHTFAGCGLALLLGTGLPGTGAAQDESLPQLYQVEIIIFANEDFDPREELFALPPKRPRSEVEVPQQRELSSAALNIELLPGTEDGFGDMPREGFPPSGAPRQPGAGGDAATTEQAREQDPGSEQPSAGQGQGDIGADDPLDLLVELEQLPLRDVLPHGVRRLHTDELRLAGAYATLNRSGAYTPLVHVGWVQEGRPEGQAVAFDLSTLGRFTPSGTIQLYTTRFLRLGIDVEYQPRRPSPSHSAVSSANPIVNPFELTEITTAPRYRLVEDRRVRTGEVHYFDHPAFGIIATIRPQARQTGETGVPTPAP